MKKNNSIWTFFASVRLAIFTLSFLALSSIIGTIIPQGESSTFYVQKFGPKMAQFFQVLDIPDMYYSWWFVGLLGILSCNLIICSLDRFPAVLKIIRADNFSVPVNRLAKMRERKSWSMLTSDFNGPGLSDILKRNGWKPQSKKTDNGELFFSQKGAWSRTGVYIVHTSILIILAGGIIGHFLGFKGSVMIPETKSSSKIYSYDNSTPIDLGFEVRCDSFAIEYYDNGMPSDYRSSLTILENGKEVLQRDIEVNSPLTYKGITFYQSSYEGYQDFVVTIKNSVTDKSKNFVASFQKQKLWEEAGIRFGVINAEGMGKRIVRSKLWVKVGDAPAVIEWVEDGKEITAGSDNNYKISVKQMYATGLQVARDPGVWLVYIGCGLMLLGLFIAFFMSHKRIWLSIQRDDDKTSSLLLSGSANKNRTDFSRQFSLLAEQLSKKIGSTEL
ncbi:MAG: cytochrome c biogenesis protein ResB [Deltaproteobacteria bacterium]|nr:cytochrome c biogenesis protein ResB [Deltaproteobacteria bacterium]